MIYKSPNHINIFALAYLQLPQIVPCNKHFDGNDARLVALSIDAVDIYDRDVVYPVRVPFMGLKREDVGLPISGVYA